MASLSWGERAPELLLPPVEGVPVTFYERFCGHPTLVLGARSGRELHPFQSLSDQAGILGIVTEDSWEASDGSMTVLQDDGKLARLFWEDLPQPNQVNAVVLDPRLRLVDRFTDTDPAAIAAALDTLPPALTSGPVVTATAPVLMLPQILAPTLCRQLIDAHEADHEISGLVRVVKGQPTLVPDDRVKRRRDHRLQDPVLMQSLTEAVSRRILPAIAGAFNYQVTRFEAFKVVAYDGETGGYFRRHRDNISPDARHRRFALSINLNDEYEGGYLVFPEFGPMGYRPPAGGAIVFSGNLLHEATDVTAGRRYVVISFLWGEDVR